MQAIRDRVPFLAEDRYFAADIEAIKSLVACGHYTSEAATLLPSG
jgi:histidine ammonia-lyase